MDGVDSPRTYNVPSCAIIQFHPNVWSRDRQRVWSRLFVANIGYWNAQNQKKKEPIQQPNLKKKTINKTKWDIFFSFSLFLSLSCRPLIDIDIPCARKKNQQATP